MFVIDWHPESIFLLKAEMAVYTSLDSSWATWPTRILFPVWIPSWALFANPNWIFIPSEYSFSLHDFLHLCFHVLHVFPFFPSSYHPSLPHSPTVFSLPATPTSSSSFSLFAPLPPLPHLHLLASPWPHILILLSFSFFPLPRTFSLSSPYYTFSSPSFSPFNLLPASLTLLLHPSSVLAFFINVIPPSSSFSSLLYFLCSSSFLAPVF